MIFLDAGLRQVPHTHFVNEFRESNFQAPSARYNYFCKMIILKLLKDFLLRPNNLVALQASPSISRSQLRNNSKKVTFLVY